jgi:hypothetical protein
MADYLKEESIQPNALQSTLRPTPSRRVSKACLSACTRAVFVVVIIVPMSDHGCWVIEHMCIEEMRKAYSVEVALG